MDASLRFTPFVVLLLVTLGADQVQATDPVCRDTPASDERVYCEEDAASTTNIDINLDGVTTDTTADREQGAAGVHYGTGDITIDVEDSSFTTRGDLGQGVYGWQAGTGNIDIDVRNITAHTHGLEANGVYAWKTVGNGNINIDVTGSMITTEGGRSYGIIGQQDQSGYVDINVFDGTTVLTKGEGSHAVFGWHWAVITQQDNIDINVQDSSITTEGLNSNGIYGFHEKGKGDIDIFVQGGSTTTQGNLSPGIYAWHQLNDVVAAQTGDIDIDVNGGSITTKGFESHGIRGSHESTGDITIDLKGGVDIITESVARDPTYDETFSHGIYGDHRGTVADGNNIDINVQGGTIETRGVISHGIYARSRTESNIDINTSADITTVGSGSHGVYAESYGLGGEVNISVEGGSVTASGADASGVRVGRIRNDVVQRSAQVGEDGYRDQTVTVNGRVMGNDAGVYLAGGGRVVIGPRGSIASESGIAILATGDTPAVDPMDPAIQPKLWVDLNLGGRRVAQALGDNWIINDGGETTIAVNRTVLHDGGTGVTGNTARNGAWNVTDARAWIQGG